MLVPPRKCDLFQGVSRDCRLPLKQRWWKLPSPANTQILRRFSPAHALHIARSLGRFLMSSLAELRCLHQNHQPQMISLYLISAGAWSVRLPERAPDLVIAIPKPLGPLGWWVCDCQPSGGPRHWWQAPSHLEPNLTNTSWQIIES